MTQSGRVWQRAFLTIAVGQAVSLIGSSAVQFALIWWLSSETGSPMMLSLAGLMAFLPQMILGPFAGVWVDRLKRKTVIICADLAIGAVATVFALFFMFGEPPFWSACAVLGLRALGGVFHTPAIQAAVPMLVPKDELVRANGWSQFLQSGAFMLGPVLGAFLYAALPMWAILLSDLAGAIVASLTVASVDIPDPERGRQALPHFLGELKEGAKLFLNDKKLLIVTAATAACMVFSMPISSFYPLMTSDYFQATAWHASAVELGYAGGMMLGAALVSRLTIKNKLGFVHLGLLEMGVVTLICGLLPSNMAAFWAFAVLCCLLGAGGNLYNIPYIAYLQESVPHDKQGRAFSLMNSILSFSMPVGLLIAGPVAERHGVPAWFTISGVAFLLITAASAVMVFARPPRDARWP